MKYIPQNRWQAFGVHFCISVLIFLALASTIYFLWYPGFLFMHDGGIDGMKLIAGVDLVIGPLLTLFVYKLGKKSLRFDLSCIAVLQIACIVGGMWVVSQMRPVAIVMAGGHVGTVNIKGFQEEKINPFEASILKDERWPVWMALDMEKEEVEALQQIWSIMGSTIHTNVDVYISYKDSLNKLNNWGYSAKEITGKVTEKKAIAIKAFIKESKIEENKLPIRFYLVTTSLQEGVLAINTKDGKVVDSFF